MTLNVPVPLIIWFLGPTVTLQITWHNLPNSFEHEVSHISFNVGCRRSWLFYNSLPESSSKTGRAYRTCEASLYHNSMSSLGYLRLTAWEGCTVKARDWVQWATGSSGTAGGAMGGIVDGAAGGTGLCRAQVRCATGCAGTAGSGTSTLGARGRSMLSGFYTLGAFVVWA